MDEDLKKQPENPAAPTRLDLLEGRVSRLEAFLTPPSQPPQDAMITVYRKAGADGAVVKVLMSPIDFHEAEKNRPGEWTTEPPPPDVKIVGPISPEPLKPAINTGPINPDILTPPAEPIVPKG